jgi:hypothetical protein
MKQRRACHRRRDHPRIFFVDCLFKIMNKEAQEEMESVKAGTGEGLNK